jgi:outer membrane murein-binding lipoprotein Lpp
MTTLTPEQIHPFPPTMQDLERAVVDLTTEVNLLNSEVEALQSDREFWRDKYNVRMAQIDNLEMYVKENFDYIDENVSQELVDIFALEITKDYDVTVTVTFSGTVSVPLNYDMDDLENDLSASLESHYYSANVEADFSEDRMEIDWSES